MDRFLAAHAAEVDPRTIRTLRERLVRPLAEFGDRSLDDLGRSVADIAAWQAMLPHGHRPKILGALSQVLERAVAWKLIPENPVRLAAPGSGGSPVARRSSRSRVWRSTESRLSSGLCTGR
ncbi:MAG: hypothetical protein H0U90_00815 [Actinobacteria bacterium]|nr:hypothetical protein [Actinomycetota bacterium]